MAGLGRLRRPGPAALFVFGVSLFVCYWPGISGAGTSPRWALLAAVAFVGVFTCGRLRVTLLHIVGAVLIAWALASYLWTAAPLDTIGAAWKLVVVGCVFAIASQCGDLKPFYFGAAAGAGISGLIAIAQLCGYALVPDVTPDQPVGLFINRLVMAEAAALVGVALIAAREFALLPLTLPSIVLPCERGPILAFAFVGALSLWRLSRSAALGLAAAGIVFCVMITGWANPNGSDAIQPGTRIETAAQRVTIWRAVVPVVSTFGRGLGSYRDAAPQPIAGFQLEHAHNELIETVFEIGLIGAVLLALFFGGAIATAPLSVEGIVLLALMMEAAFAFPLHEPTTVAFGALCAGGLSRPLPRAGAPLDLGGKLL
jgi:hypothetical protein